MGFNLGITLSILWISLIIFFSYYYTTLKPEDKRPYYRTGPGLVGFITLIANVYYMTNKNTVNEEDKQSVNSTYANITLAPIYLVILVIIIGILSSLIVTKKRK